MGGILVQNKKCFKTYLSPTHRSEGPQLLTPLQASVQPENKNVEPKARGTRGVDTTSEVAQQSDTSLRSRDTDEGQSPPAQPAARPMPHPCL